MSDFDSMVWSYVKLALFLLLLIFIGYFAVILLPLLIPAYFGFVWWDRRRDEKKARVETIELERQIDEISALPSDSEEVIERAFEKLVYTTNISDHISEEQWFQKALVRTSKEAYTLTKAPDTKEFKKYFTPEGRQYRKDLKKWIDENKGDPPPAIDLSNAIEDSFVAFGEHIPLKKDADDPFMEVSTELLELVDAKKAATDIMIPFLKVDPIYPYPKQILTNLKRASGVPADAEFHKEPIWPEKHRGSNEQIIDTYLGGTGFPGLFLLDIKTPIPSELRFRHMHMVGGSGHGKTQTLQHMLVDDMEKIPDRSVIVLDGQGDLINKLKMRHNNVVLIDPEDLEYPPALNLFDIGQARLEAMEPLEREKALNTATDLLSYIINALLGAELTSKQETLWRYVIRLMVTIPGANIQTLMQLMSDDTPFLQYIEKLDDTPRRFFKEEWNGREFAQTKKQVVRRLYTLLENKTFEAMFSNAENKIDLFKEMNQGKLILINTSKALLKGSHSVFGRFFIAAIFQAAMARSVMPENERKPTFLYIDECHEYLDGKVVEMLEQCRKMKLGLILAHQGLYQLDPTTRQAIMANTALKFAGGVSADDAKKLSHDMQCSPEFIQKQKVEPKAFTEFAFYTSLLGSTAASVKFEFGRLESIPTTDTSDWHRILNANRQRYCTLKENTETVGQYNKAEELEDVHTPRAQSGLVDPDGDEAVGHI